MVITAYLPILLLGARVAYSTPVPWPPNDLPKTFGGSRPGTRIIQKSQPLVQGEASPPEFTAREDETVSISIPSVNEEKVGRGWLNNIAGPPLDSFTSLQQPNYGDGTGTYQDPPLYKEQFRGVKLQQESNLDRLKTAHEEEFEESDPEELAYTPGENTNYNYYADEPHTARFKAQPQQSSRLTLQFSDAEDQGINIDEEEEEETYEEEKEPDYDPASDPFYRINPRDSPLRHVLRRLLEEPLYKPLPTWKGNPKKLLIDEDDSSATARRKMRHNLQSIPEGPSIMELQSTLRGGEGLPHIRKKIGAVNPKFLPQGRESLQLPSPGLNPSSRVASIEYSQTDDQINREPQTITLTLPEVGSVFRGPKDTTVPKLRLRMNDKAL
ncbi:hypothetical protein TWF281_001035 [Arthrobotrys megalospora]